MRKKMVDLTRFELVTSRLSAGRSNQLSYRSIALGNNSRDATRESTTFLKEISRREKPLIINFIRTPPTFIRTCADECGNPIP